MKKETGLDPKYKIEILRALDYHFPGKKKIILFGSRARGTNKIGSDVDIAIDKGKSIALHEMARARITLENLIIPFTIDLVDMQTIPQELKQTILEEGVEWKN